MLTRILDTISMQVASAVSGKTNYLVAGDLLDDGRPVAESSKYRTAVEKKVRVFVHSIEQKQKKLYFDFVLPVR